MGTYQVLDFPQLDYKEGVHSITTLDLPLVSLVLILALSITLISMVIGGIKRNKEMRSNLTFIDLAS